MIIFTAGRSQVGGCQVWLTPVQAPCRSVPWHGCAKGQKAKQDGFGMQAGLEPPWLLRHRVTLSKWKPVLDALEDLVLQTSALESVLEGQGLSVALLTPASSLFCRTLHHSISLGKSLGSHV